jgi:hypothetical protein
VTVLFYKGAVRMSTVRECRQQLGERLLLKKHRHVCPATRIYDTFYILSLEVETFLRN